MLSHNKNHFNIPAIVAAMPPIEEWNEDYRFYGLKQENNPAIRIDIDLITISRGHYDDNENLKSSIEDFLNNHNISVSFSENEDGDNYGFRIGFRKDLRENVILSSCLLETIIQIFESRIKLDKNSIIPNCPKFV